MESVLAFEEVQREVERQESSSLQSSSYGLKLVPWICWDEWLFVYDALFSDSHEAFASAFRKVRHTYIHIDIHIYIHMYACMCAHIYSQTFEKQAHKKIKKKPDGNPLEHQLRIEVQAGNVAL